MCVLNELLQNNLYLESRVFKDQIPCTQVWGVTETSTLGLNGGGMSLRMLV